MTVFYLFLVIFIAIIHCCTALFLLSLPVIMCMNRAPRWYIYLQVFVFSIAAGFHFTSGVCPLTFGENYFRGLASLRQYKGNFLNHYAEAFFHFTIPDALVSNGIIVLAGLLVVMLFKKYYYSKRLKIADNN